MKIELEANEIEEVLHSINRSISDNWVSDYYNNGCKVKGSDQLKKLREKIWVQLLKNLDNPNQYLLDNYRKGIRCVENV